MHSWLPLNDIGIFAALVTAVILFHRYGGAPRHSRFPRYGTAGVVILMGGQYLALLSAGPVASYFTFVATYVNPVALFFTPIAWTGYILWVDGAVYALRGSSLLKNEPGEFAWLAACSIPLWLIFEAYNLRLHNWIYVGLPAATAARWLGYLWAFATIWPGIFETAALVRALSAEDAATKRSIEPRSTRDRPASLSAVTVCGCGGATLLVVPLLVPPGVGAYLFGAVWLGFIFLLEALNLHAGRESLWRDLLHGDPSRLKALLWAGCICGIFWEFWNYWAAARWFYTVPVFQEYKMFAMPLPGYLGFPAFAVECFTMFAFVAPSLSAIAKAFGAKRKARWQSLQL